MDALVMCGGRGTRLDAPVEKPLFAVAGEPMVDRVLDALHASAVEDVTAVTAPHAPDTREHLRERGVPTFEADGEGYVADLGQALDAHPDRPILTVVADLPLLAPGAVNRTLDAHEAGALTVCVPTALKETLDVSADTTRAAPRAAERASGERDATDESVSGERAESGGRREASPVERAGSEASREHATREQRDPRASAHGGTELAPTGLNIVGGTEHETLHVTWDARLAVNVNYRADAEVAEVLARGA